MDAAVQSPEKRLQWTPIRRRNYGCGVYAAFSVGFKLFQQENRTVETEREKNRENWVGPFDKPKDQDTKGGK
ncbi:glutamine synthetase [Sesbania bispinosa]|nr:glutamine synthetase [Sesbania bispinosa]